MKKEKVDLKSKMDKNLDELNISEELSRVNNENFNSELLKTSKSSSESTLLTEPEDDSVDIISELEPEVVDSADEDSQLESEVSELVSEENSNSEISQDFVVPKKKKSPLLIIGIVLCLIWVCFFALVIYSSVSGKDSQKVVQDGGVINVSNSQSTLEENDVSEDRKLMTAADIYEASIDSVVAIQTEKSVKNIFGQYSTSLSAGTGFIITDTGYVLTNNHVIDGASNITVIMNNNTVYKAHFAGGDVKNDVAILQLEVPAGTTFKPLTLGSLGGSRVGDDVLVIGNPLGELTNSMTRGIISAKGRQISVAENTRMEVVQIDAPINQGNSGGPLLNYYGEVIGIVSAKFASETIEGLGFCIPIDNVKANLQTIIDSGEVINTQPYLGISVTTVTDELSSYLNMPYGAYVAQVIYGSPAFKAGILQGDIITELEGLAVAGSESLIAMKNKYKIGDKITLKVFRGGKYQDIIVELGETPPAGSVSAQPVAPNEDRGNPGNIPSEGNIPPAKN